MSTHSYIGVIEEDGTLKYVYCHSDGYPSYLGRMLLTYYNTPELATELVNLGDLSMVRSMVRERLVPDKGKIPHIQETCPRRSEGWYHHRLSS